MTSSSVIFVGVPEKTLQNESFKDNFKTLFLVNVYDLPYRIFLSLVPPLCKRFKKIYVDLLGPVLAVLILTSFVNYGYYFKSTKISVSPVENILTYVLLMPLLCFVLNRVAQSNMTLLKTYVLLGYALYGHILTLFASFVFYQERSNTFFFLCLILFDGLSTLRVALIVLDSIKLPAARLIVCSVVCIVNVLFVVFLHFAYMHRTFMYKAKT